MPTPLPDPKHTSASQTLHHWIEQAVNCGASDIHFESDANSFRVRFRIDGHLRVMAQHDLLMRDALLSRLKVLARLDIAEKRLPQDGRIQYPLQQALVDLRVSSLPTLFGEKLVVRILNHSHTRPRCKRSAMKKMMRKNSKQHCNNRTA